MSSFDPGAYGTVFAKLLDTDRCRPLGPGRPDRDARGALDGLSVETTFAHAAVVDQSMARLCIAGVWLLHDYLDESHVLSQSVSTASGSFWHGIMHRREPDYSNAKYWFRRVGEHAVYPTLAEAARELIERHGSQQAASALLSQAAWNPFAFVDMCQSAEGTGGSSGQLCRDIQQREWELLFDDCYNAAIGRT